MEISKRKKILYIAIIVLLFILVLIYSYNAYIHYAAFKTHSRYIRQVSPRIESWMTVHLVTRRFNISADNICKELNINNTFRSERLVISDVCRKNHLNCSETLDRLNSLRKK